MDQENSPSPPPRTFGVIPKNCTRPPKKKAPPMEAKEVKNLRLAKSPLEIADVLEHLFGFLSVPDLCTARKVCKVWNEVAVPHLKKKSPNVKFGSDYWNPGNKDMRKYISCAESSASFPFTNLELQTMNFEKGNTYYNEFLESAALWLTGLEVDLTRFHHHPQLSSETTFPKISKLRIDTAHNNPVPEHDIFCIQLVKRAPELLRLELMDWGYNISLLKTLSQVKGLQLKELLLLYYCVIINYEKPDDMADYCRTLLDFLESQRNTLQMLRLKCDGRVDKLAPFTSSFPQLKTLNLCWSTKGNAFQKPLQYARIFPRLTSLRLCQRARDPKVVSKPADPASWEPVLWRQQPAFTVRNLSTCGLHAGLPQQLFRENGARLFPNVVRLDVSKCQGINWTILELVSMFENLTELSLDVSEVSGLWIAITGEAEKPSILETEEQWRRKMEQKPYIALQRLRLLRIKYLEANEYEHVEVDNDDDVEYLPLVPLTEHLCRLISFQFAGLEGLHLARQKRMRIPNPLPSWMAKIQANTAIIFN